MVKPRAVLKNGTVCADYKQVNVSMKIIACNLFSQEHKVLLFSIQFNNVDQMTLIVLLH